MRNFIRGLSSGVGNIWSSIRRMENGIEYLTEQQDRQRFILRQ